MAIDDAWCAECGVDRSEDPTLDDTTRTICPNCGKTSALRYCRGASETFHFSDSASVALTPGNQTRDWTEKWNHIKTRYVELNAPLTGPMDAARIEKAEHELLGLFVEILSLRDALIKELHASKDDVRTLYRTPHLALATDIANSRKHHGIDFAKHPPMTGGDPIPVNRQGGSNPSGGWSPQITFAQHGRQFDGLSAARAAIDAIENWLRSKSLI